MSKQNDTPVLIISLLVTLGLLGAGAWWFTRSLDLGNLFSGGDSAEVGGGRRPSGAIADRLSGGERVLVTQEASADKQAGVRAIAAGDFQEAVSSFEAALAANRNDPEALIYRNNAQIGNQPAHLVAVAVPIGSSVNSALEILRGVAQAQTDINQAGGINGVPLQVMIADDNGDPDTSRQVAEALAANRDVLGVVGHFGSDSTLAAGEVYQANGLTAISPTSTSMSISELGDAVFRTVPSDRFTAAALSRHMVNTLQQQNAAVFFNANSDYSRSLKDEFTTALYGDGGQIVGEFDLGSSGFNAGQSVNQARQQGAEVLVLAANTATLDQALQVMSVNRQEITVLGGDSIYNPRVLQEGGAPAVGTIVAVPWHILFDPQSDFAQTSRQLWGGDVNWRTAMAYDATQVLIAGLEQNPTRDGVRQALSAGGFSAEGASGPIRFLPSGDRNQAAQLVVVEPGSRSGYGYDFVPASQN